MRTSSRNVAVLLFDEVELWDVSALMHVTSAAGRHWNWRPFRLYPTAVAPGLIATRSQLRLEASVALEDCPSPEIVFVPGGYGARRAAADPAVTAWCARAAAEAQLLVAIGAGVAVLGKAGLLDGQQIAAAKDNREWLATELPQTTLNSEDALVTSGRLLTAASSSHGIDLGLLVVERALGSRVATALRGTLGYPLMPSRLELPASIQIPLGPRR